MYFHVRRGELGRWTVLHVTGEIDLATAPTYRRELLAAAGSADALAIDLGDCDLVDSVGLGVTIGAARRVRERGGSFTVVVNSRVRQLFERCRLDEIMHLVDDLASLTEPGTALVGVDARSAGHGSDTEDSSRS